MISTIVGTLAGGAVVAKIGMKRSLWVFGVLQSVSTLTFYALAKLGYHTP
jgi:PAT family beta-lactamase induction signal transducer AmpG